MMNPKEWVDENLNEFGNPISVIGEMLEAMRGSLIPDTWIDEALAYVSSIPADTTSSRKRVGGFVLRLKWSAIGGFQHKPVWVTVQHVFSSRSEAHTFAREQAKGWIACKVLPS